MADWYMRTVLTVIAALLAGLLVERFRGPMQVRVLNGVYVLGGLGDPLDVKVVGEPKDPRPVRICDTSHCADLSSSRNIIGGIEWGLVVAPAK
jgi:hypothetical protein